MTLEKTDRSFALRGDLEQIQAQLSHLDNLGLRFTVEISNTPEHGDVVHARLWDKVKIGYVLWHMYLRRTPGFDLYRKELVDWNFCRDANIDTGIER